MPTDNETEEHWRCWQSFSLEAYTRFQTALERHRDRHPGLTSYDIVQKVNETKGTFVWFWELPAKSKRASTYSMLGEFVFTSGQPGTTLFRTIRRRSANGKFLITFWNRSLSIACFSPAASQTV